jgi:hypothetical protein
VLSLVADAATILFDSPLKSTELGDHFEACVIERRESALNGDEERWMGRVFSSTLFIAGSLWQAYGVIAAGDIVQDSLDEDDAYVDAAGDIG